MDAPRPTPRFLPDPPDLSRALFRAATAAALCEIGWQSKQVTAEAILQERYPGDTRAVSVLRAATAPISTSTVGALQPNVTAAFLSGLMLKSAAARLIGLGVQLSLDGIATISVPRVLTISPLGFVAEGAPFPVSQQALTTVTLGPTRKVGGISVLTNELAEHSTPNAEALIRQLQEESSALALDAAVFSAAAADSTRPAGILNGTAPLTPTAGGGLTAMIADIKALIGAIADAQGGNTIVFVTNARQAAAIKLQAGPKFDYEVIASPAVAAGTVIALDPAAFCSAFTEVPQIDTGRAATLHLEDTTPLQIGTAGSPPTVAAPVRNLFQTDSFSLRIILNLSFVMRNPMIAWLSGATW